MRSPKNNGYKLPRAKSPRYSLINKFESIACKRRFQALLISFQELAEHLKVFLLPSRKFEIVLGIHPWTKSPRYSANDYKKKFLLPVLLIFFLVIILVVRMLPKIDFNLQLPQTKIVNPAVEQTKEENFINMLGQHGLVVESLNFGQQEITATLSGKLTVLFSSHKDLEFQVASLQLIVSRSKIDGRIPKKIDLRFDKPIAIY